MKKKKFKRKGEYTKLKFTEHSFGFHRAEVIAALISVLTIWVLTAFLVHEAILRINNPQEINAKLVG